MLRLIIARPLCTVEVDASADVAALREAVGRKCGQPIRDLRLHHHGRALATHRPLGELGVRSGDTVHALGRLRGGGGDGGVYPPTAHELKWMNDIGGGTKRNSWAVLGGSVSRTQFERASASLRRFEACATCALSGEPLRAPVVCCELGMLYNKTALLEALLARATRPLDARVSHVRSLRDVVDVTLHADPLHAAARAATAADASEDGLLGAAPFQCPVTKLPFNGRHPFYAIRCSGHVVSERALAMTRWAVCPVSEAPLRPAAPPPAAGAAVAGRRRLSPDLVPLALADDELDAARAALGASRAADGGGSGGKKRAAQQPAHGAHGAPVAGVGAGSGKRARAADDAGPSALAGEAMAACSERAMAARSERAPPGAAGAAAAPAEPATRVSSLAVGQTVQAAREEVARKAQSGVFSSLFLPQATKDEEARKIRDGKDYMTRAIQPGRLKER